jgi:diguanylate cyclase (GGDEF)-like protein
MLEEMYIRDPMTKLLNRRGFYKAAPKIYSKCLNEELEFMIVSVDMDNLKTINDTYGHAEGDNAIIKIAEALNSVSQGGFITARFGGDEYVAAGICLSDGYGKAYVRGITEYLDDYNKTSGKPYTLGASCGVYKAVPQRDVTLDEFISEADKIMYSVKKRRKRNRPELSRRR